MKGDVEMMACEKCGRYVGCAKEKKVWIVRDEVRVEEDVVKMALLCLCEKKGINMVQEIKKMNSNSKYRIELQLIVLKKRNLHNFTMNTLEKGTKGVIILHHCQGIP